jgi:hypothetical protein
MFSWQKNLDFSEHPLEKRLINSRKFVRIFLYFEGDSTSEKVEVQKPKTKRHILPLFSN